MQRILCLVALLSSVIANQSAAQFAISADSPNLKHGDYVIQQGADILSTHIVSIVAQSLKPRLPGWPENLGSGAVVVSIEDERADFQDARLIKLSVAVRNDKLQPDEAEMRKLWDLARRELEKELERLAKLAYEAQFTRLRNALDEHEAERGQLGEQAAKLTQRVALLEAETAGSDRDSLAKAIAEAVSNQRGLQLEAAGIQAQREAIEKRIDELREMAAAQGDPIVSELERVVNIREAERQHLEKANENTPGAIPEARFLEAEGRIAEAKIEFLRAQRDAEDRLSGGALRELNNELSKLLVESAKVTGQQKQLEQVIAELREQVVSTAQAAAALAPLRTEMQAIVNQRQHVDSEINNLRRSLDALSEPAVSLQPLIDDPLPRESEESAPGDSDAPGTDPGKP